MDYEQTLKDILDYMDAHPSDFGAYKDCFDVVRAYYGEDKALASRHCLDLRKATIRQVHKQGSDVSKFFDLNKKTYLLMARDDFHSYMVYLEWDREPEKRFYVPRMKILRPIVQDMQDLMDDKLDLLTISLPPGTGKSTLQIFLHSWNMGRFPDKCNLASGHSGMLTGSIYDGVLGVLNDPEYLWHEVFPEVSNVITNAKETTIDLNKKHRFSTLTCRAIGASLTGATRCEGLLTADDMVSGIEEACSKERLDKLWSSYTNDLKSRKKIGAKELHLATRWSVHDPIGRLERMYYGDKRCKFVVLPALNEAGESNFNYSYGVGFDTKFFMDMKSSLDDVSFRALYMNQPIEREGLLYHPDDLRRFYELPEGEPDAIIAVCDTAEGGGDDTFLPVAYVYGQDYYIGDCVCSNALPEVTDNLCAEVLVRTNAKMCQFESNSAGGRTADKVAATVKERGGVCHITKRRTTANKETKIIVNSPWVKEHCLFLDASKVQRGSMYAAMLDKLCSYTVMGKNKHDDVPDGMAQLALFAQSLAANRVEVFDRPF